MKRKAIAAPLLGWYYQSRRSLPFRADPTPYHIWVSEIMLQQTRVAAAVPYYERFIEALPTVQALAACEPERLAKLWEGLGYYSRARNLQKAAQLVVAQHGGELPRSYEGLLSLPGIGAYTAGAIASIGMGLCEVAVDGNVLRVFSRLFAEAGDIAAPAVKARLTALVKEQQPADVPGDFNQALMELGALVCLPGAAAQCRACPLAAQCEARAQGTAALLPVKAPKKQPQPWRVALALVHTADGRWLLQKRPASGMLAGLWQPYWVGGAPLTEDAPAFSALWEALPAAFLPESGEAFHARHVFTHQVWEMEARFFTAAEENSPPGCIWASPAELESSYALPTAFKACRRAMLARKK